MSSFFKWASTRYAILFQIQYCAAVIGTEHCEFSNTCFTAYSLRELNDFTGRQRTTNNTKHVGYILVSVCILISVINVMRVCLPKCLPFNHRTLSQVSSINYEEQLSPPPPVYKMKTKKIAQQMPGLYFFLYKVVPWPRKSHSFFYGSVFELGNFDFFFDFSAGSLAFSNIFVYFNLESIDLVEQDNKLKVIQSPTNFSHIVFQSVQWFRFRF